MLLGKRPRPPIKRTTSMTGITVDLRSSEALEPSDHILLNSTNQLTPQNNPPPPPPPPSPLNHYNHVVQNNNVGYFGYSQESYSHHNFPQSMLSPRTSANNIQRRNSADFIETADFLRTCGLCKRRLASGRDIYIYMGDMAFCSLECREKHIKQAERKDKATAPAGTLSDDRRHKTAT